MATRHYYATGYTSKDQWVKNLKEEYEKKKNMLDKNKESSQAQSKSSQTQKKTSQTQSKPSQSKHSQSKTTSQKATLNDFTKPYTQETKNTFQATKPSDTTSSNKVDFAGDLQNSIEPKKQTNKKEDAYLKYVKYKQENKENKGLFGAINPNSKETRTPEEQQKVASNYLNKFTPEQKKYLDSYTNYKKQYDEQMIWTNSLANIGAIGGGGSIDPSMANEQSQYLKGMNESLAKFQESTGLSDKEVQKAIEYAQEVSDKKNREENQKDFKENAKSAPGKLFNTLLSSGAQMQSGGWAVGENLNYRVNGYADDKAPINTNSTYYELNNISNDAKAATLKEIEENNNQVDAFLYKAASSGLDNYVRMAPAAMLSQVGTATKLTKTIAEQASLIPMTGNVYATTVDNAQNQGMTADEAQMAGAISATIEYATEKAGFDAVFDNLIIKSSSSFAKRLLASMFAEAGEEFVSGVVTPTLEAIMFGDKSEAIKMYNDLIDDGVSESEAKKRVVTHYLKEAGSDAAVAAVSTFMLSGPIEGAKDYSDTKSGKEAFADDNYKEVAESIDDTLDIGKEAKAYAEGLAEKVENGKKVTSNEKRALWSMVRENVEQSQELENDPNYIKQKEAQIEATKAAATQGVSQTLTDLNTVLDNPIQTVGSNEQQVNATLNQVELETPEKFRAKSDVNIEDAISNINNANNVEELANAYNEAKASARTPQDNGIIENLMNSRKQKMNVTNEDLENVMTLDKAYQTGVRNEELTTDNAFVREAYNEGRRNRLAQNSPKTATARANGREFTIDTIKNVKGETYVTTNEGETVPLSVVSFANPEMYNVYGEASLSANPQAFIDGYTEISDKDISLEAYSNTLENVYNYARLHGDRGSFEKAIKNEAFTNLIPESTLKSMYNEGLKDTQTKSKKVTKSGKKAQGKVTDENNRLSKNGRKLMKAISDKLGVDVEIVDNQMTVDGKTVNGFFDADNNKIVLNAEGQNVFKTLIHEVMGEMSEAYSSEKMDELQLAIIDYELARNPKKFNDTVENYRQAYIKHEGSKSYREAADEYVNDILVELFSDEQGMKDFANFIADKQSVKETFLEFIDNIVSAIKELMGDNTNSRFKDDIEAMQRLRKMALDTWQTAIDNKLALENGETELKQASSLDVRNSIEPGTLEQKAIEHFGTTENFRTGGYILQDGTMLDFSGAHWLEGESPEYIADWKSKNDIRQVDHEDIYEVMKASGDNRKQFMDRGNIRISPEAPGINISATVEPTPAQYRQIKEFIREVKKNPYYNATRFFLDLEGDKPNKVTYSNNLNEDRVVSDIKRFYETGELTTTAEHDFRFSLGGLSAYTADTKAAKEAQDLLKDGKTPEEVFKTTGWYKGVDGKWRFEISNKDSSISKEGFAKFFNEPEFIKMKEVEKEWMDASNDITTPERKKRFLDLGDEYEKLLSQYTKKAGNKEDFRLNNILYNDELFKAYPSLERVHVKFGIINGKPSVKGAWVSSEQTIVLNPSLVFPNDIRKTLLHEVQHAIQWIEGFAEGSSEEFWKEYGASEYLDSRDVAEHEKKTEVYNSLLENAPKDFTNRYEEYSTLMKAYGGLAQNDESLYEKANSIYKELKNDYPDLLDAVEDASWEMDMSEPYPREMIPYEAYYYTAGEIEAREVSERADMTDEERRNNLPKMKGDNGNVFFAENPENPTDSSDIRYSIEVDSTGKELTTGQKRFFNNTKAVDEDGDLQRVFHGTLSEFYEFDKEKANPEGNLGKGFYFTNVDYDAENNYADRNGPDFTNKVEREAELLEDDERYSEMDHDEIVEMLKDKYATDPMVLEGYLNIQNPVYINKEGKGDTYLFDFEDELPNYDDFEDEDEYYQEVEDIVGDKVYEALDAVKDYLGDDYYESEMETLSEIIGTAAMEGGITYEQLRSRLNDANAFFETEDGIAQSEVLRIIAESLGYDGIIDSSVSDKFTAMNMPSDTTHYVVFDSNQFKLADNENPTDNPDIRYSLDVDSEGNKLTKDQKKFFANSEVRDEEGRLIPLYHTTNSVFTKFNTSGIWLSEDKGYSLEYADKIWQDRRAGAVYDKNEIAPKLYGDNDTYTMKLYANITNPFDSTVFMDNTSRHLNSEFAQNTYKAIGITNVEDFDKYRGIVKRLNHHMVYELFNDSEFHELLKKFGFDGIKAVENSKLLNNEFTVPTWCAFDSSQVKLATNGNPSENEDIRFSLEVENKVDDIKKRAKRYSMYDDAWEELEDAGLVGNYNKVADDTMAQILDSVNNLFKGQEIGANSIKTVAKEIKEYTGSTINTATLEDELDMLFNHMQREDNQLNMDEMFDLFKVVARDVVKKMPSESVDDEFRSYVKSLRISLTDTQKEEVAHVYGSYNEFRQRNMGNLTITNDGMTLDELWNEIADQSNFGLSDNVSEAEQPLVLVDYLNALKEQPLNNYGASMDELATDTAIRILEKYYAAEQQALTNKALLDNPSAKKALDDARANMRKADQEFRKQVKEKYDAEVERLTKEREDAINSSQFFYKRTKDLESQLANASSEADKEEIRKLKSQLDRKDKALIKAQAKAKQPLTEYQEQLGRKEEKRKIMQISNRLMKMVYAPTEKLHMPEEFRKPIGEFLSGIDFITHRSEMDSIPNLRWQTKMDNLRDYLKNAGSNTNATQSELNLAELLEEELLEDMATFTFKHSEVRQLSRMSKEDLHDFYSIISRISATVSKTNQTFANSVYESITKLNEDSLKEMKELDDPKINGGILQPIKDFFSKNLEDPITYFSLLGKAPKTIYDGLLKGFDRRAGHIKDSQEYMQSILPKDSYKWEKEKHTFETHNGKLELSTAQIMSLYELNKRKAAGHHLFSGGIKGLYNHVFGNVTQSNKTYHLTDPELNNIFGVLTPEQIEIADKIQEYMANECAKWGNNVSMTLWGYNKFTEKDYFPMKVDSTSRATSNNDTNVPNLYANKNMSSSKELKDMADNPLLIGSIFDVFTEHVADMATYDGMVLPQMDAMRWFNYKVKDIEGGGRAYFDSTKQEINRLYSKAGETYFTNLMLGINGTEPKARGVQILNWLIGHYKKVAVMAKIRVAIQQPTSITRAYDEMDAKYLSQALATTNPVKYSKIAKENSMLAWWKGQGYYEAYLGKGLKEIIVGKNPVVQKIEDFEGWGAQTADDLTWGILYHAAELEIKDKHPELKGKEFTNAVVERFEDVVSKTQVVDTMLHRTDIMRSQSELAKITTSFMTEPLKTYNMLLRSIVGAWRNKDKKSIAHLIKTIFVYLINGAFLSMVTTTWDALRKDDDETKYGDRWLELYGQEVADNLNPLTMIPVVKDVVDIVSSKFNGEYRSGTDMTYDGISRAAQFGAHVFKKASGGELSITDYGLAKEGAQALSIISGVPVYNVWNDIEGIHNGFFDNWETKVQSPYKSFYKAIDNGDDLTEAINELHEAGKEDQYIKAQITSHYKPIYLETTDMTEKANLKNALIKAYMAAGDTREAAIKKIDKW